METERRDEFSRTAKAIDVPVLKMKNILLYGLISALLSHCAVPCKDNMITTIAGNDLAYSECGAGNPIVFAHAGGLNKEMWRAQQDFLSRDFQVLSYDLRGHGNSKMSNNSTKDLEDLHFFLNTLEIDQVTLVGSSLGAIIALDYAIAHPERIDRLVLVSPGLVGFQEKNIRYLANLKKYVEAVNQTDTLALLETLKLMTTSGEAESHLLATVDDYVDRSLKHFVQHGFHLRPPQIQCLDPLGEIGKFNFPIALFYGGQDFSYIHDNVNALARRLDHAQIFEFPQAGHLLNMQQPHDFNLKLLQFLETATNVSK